MDSKILKAIMLGTAGRQRRVSHSAALKTGPYIYPNFSCDPTQVA